MSLLSRRLTTALLWIAIALLPVRGAAAVLMPMMMAGVQPPAVASTPTADNTVAEMPCHAASQDTIGSSNSASTCSMCDLCHITVAQAATVSVNLPELHEAPPYAAAPTAIEPRAPDDLFRPPRSFLA
jgi:hypothetical protein